MYVLKGWIGSADSYVPLVSSNGKMVDKGVKSVNHCQPSIKINICYNTINVVVSDRNYKVPRLWYLSKVPKRVVVDSTVDRLVDADS